MLSLHGFDDFAGVGRTLFGVKGHDACVFVGRVRQTIGFRLRDGLAGVLGNRLSRFDIPPMPADLHDHAHHADDGERCTSSDLSDGECDDRDNRGQETQPWHQCDDDRNVAFAVEAVGEHAEQHGQQDDGGGQPECDGQDAQDGAAPGHAALGVVEAAATGAGSVESRAQILDLAFGFVFVAAAAFAGAFTLFAGAFTFAGLPHACLSLRSRSPYATRYGFVVNGPRGSQCLYVLTVLRTVFSTVCTPPSVRHRTNVETESSQELATCSITQRISNRPFSMCFQQSRVHQRIESGAHLPLPHTKPFAHQSP